MRNSSSRAPNGHGWGPLNRKPRPCCEFGMRLTWREWVIATHSSRNGPESARGLSQVPGARYRRNSGDQWVPGPPGDPGMYRSPPARQSRSIAVQNGSGPAPGS